MGSRRHDVRGQRTGAEDTACLGCFQLGSEGVPGAGGEGQLGAGLVLAVADCYGGASGADLDTGSAVAAAVTACTPRAAGHAHRSSATFLIRSRETARDSASARSLSNVRAM